MQGTFRECARAMPEIMRLCHVCRYTNFFVSIWHVRVWRTCWGAVCVFDFKCKKENMYRAKYVGTLNPGPICTATSAKPFLFDEELLCEFQHSSYALFPFACSHASTIRACFDLHRRAWCIMTQHDHHEPTISATSNCNQSFCPLVNPVHRDIPTTHSLWGQANWQLDTAWTHLQTAYTHMWQFAHRYYGRSEWISSFMAHTHSFTHTHMHTHTQKEIHSGTFADPGAWEIHTPWHRHGHTNIAPTDITPSAQCKLPLQLHTHTHKYTHRHTHTDTHTHTQKHTHTQTLCMRRELRKRNMTGPVSDQQRRVNTCHMSCNLIALCKACTHAPECIWTTYEQKRDECTYLVRWSDISPSNAASSPQCLQVCKRTRTLLSKAQLQYPSSHCSRITSQPELVLKET